MCEDMIEEALWPTQVSSAIDVFPTDRYESDSRLKGTIDLDGYTSQSEYPLVGWRCTGVVETEGAPINGTMWALNAIVKLATVGEEDIDGSATAASSRLVTDCALASSAIVAQMDDGRCLDGPFAIYDASVVNTGKDSSAAYHVWGVTVGEPEITRAVAGGDGGEDEWGADDRLGFNVWIGEIPVTIKLLVV